MHTGVFREPTTRGQQAPEEVTVEGDTEEAQFLPVPRVSQKAHVNSIAEYKRLYDHSISDPNSFWGGIAEGFHWEKKWDLTQPISTYNFDVTKGGVSIKWFPGAQTNICYNCLDRNVILGLGAKIAFYWEGNEPGDASSITYAQLLVRVSKFANVLKSKGIVKGDRVAIYMPMVLESIVAMLACARIGAVHSVVFGGFSAEALSDRIVDSQAKVVVTSDCTFRGSKMIDLKAIVDVAIARCSERAQFTVNTVIIAKNEAKQVQDFTVKLVDGRDEWFHVLEASADPNSAVAWMDSEDYLFMLYTSGSTGKPKGVVHTTGGYMVYAATTLKYTFDLHSDDIYWCTADIGWVTGHTYITYGPLLNGATSVMFEGIPTYPDAGRLWQVVEKYKVTQFYTAPTAIRALMRYGDQYVTPYNLSSLRILGTVGEPINPKAWLWYFHTIGQARCSIVDTYWQTETGGHIITGLPGAITMKPGSASTHFLELHPSCSTKRAKKLQVQAAATWLLRAPGLGR